jgi:Tol biopolymer transport system component
VGLAPSTKRAVIVRVVGGNSDIWIVDRAGGAATRLTVDPAQEVFPIWMPNETAVVFRSSRNGTGDIFQASVEGEGSEQLVLGAAAVGVAQISPTDISPDGRWLFFYSTPESASRDVWVHHLGQPSETRKLVGTSADESSPRVSPDGRWFAYQSNESGRYEIAVRGFPTGERVWRVSTAGGVRARWSRDGRELFYVDPEGKLMAVTVSATGSMFRAAPPVALFTPRFVESPAVNPFNAHYDVAADGRFLINVAVDDLASAPITLLLNWRGR